MNRRAFFTNFNSSQNATVLPPSSSLAPYTGEWTPSHAAHLLRRTTFGAQYQEIIQFSEMTMEQAVDKICSIAPLVNDLPLNYDFEGDPDVPIGSTWVGKPYDIANNSNNYRLRSMQGWTISRLLKRELNVREKMTLFWHNHFPVSDIMDARYYYKYIDLFRQNPLGNFKEYCKQITIDPCMLRYLNGNQNTKNAPNENYARELLELFTIGKGPQTGPGDYTNYTEDDVLVIAKVLTGWRDVGYRNPNIDMIGSEFRPAQHDVSVKTLSHRFNNAVINNAGVEEYKNLINIIFQQEEVSRFIARKLYRWFVYYNIDEGLENDIILPLAKIIRDNNYEIKPALIALLKSDHFYSDFGCMIKHPLDFIATLLNQTNTYINNDLQTNYRFWFGISTYSSLLQMRYFELPSVAGWKAFYQEPLYYQTWVNSVTLPLRNDLTDAAVNPTINVNGMRADIDVLSLIKSLSNPADINTLIEDFVLLMMPKPLAENQLLTLKEIMIPGLPDYEWTIEYEDHLNNPNDVQLRRAVENKIRAMLTYLMRMPEYQLS